eukprot:1793780-Amphidinium_carterae.1
MAWTLRDGSRSVFWVHVFWSSNSSPTHSKWDQSCTSTTDTVHVNMDGDIGLEAHEMSIENS